MYASGPPSPATSAAPVATAAAVPATLARLALSQRCLKLDTPPVNPAGASLGPPGSPSAIINELYKKKAGHDLDDASARVMQGLFVLADAINRAGSTEPAAIQQALQQTELKREQLIVGYDGVKFDATGQNILGSSYLIQLQGKAYTAVWPAANAPAKLILPYKGRE